MSWPNQSWPAAMQKVPYILAQSNVPVGIANTGTITGSSTGNLLLGTAMDLTYGPTSNNIPGIWLYFPSTAFSASAAGYYWCVMTSTTVGTVYGVAYAAPGLAGIGSTNSIVTGSGSQYTGGTGTYYPINVVQIPGNSMGPNGHIRVTACFSDNSTSNNKFARIFVYTSTTVTSGVGSMAAAITTNTAQQYIVKFANTGVTNSNAWIQAGGASYASGTGAAVAAYDTTQPLYIGIGLQISTATDFINCMNYCVEILSS